MVAAIFYALLEEVIAYQEAEEIHAYQIHGQRLTLRQSLR